MSSVTGKNTYIRGGTSTLTVLGLIFVVLKLTGTITWSWWWVLAPFWGGAILGILVVFLIIGFLVLFK